MPPALFAREISLCDLEDKFHLQWLDQPFLEDWVDPPNPLTEADRQALDQVRRNYLNLIRYQPMSEGAVKMVVLSPLLDLAGFYQPPFRIETETSIRITADDRGLEVKGNIDVLVLQGRLWILIIESKGTKFDVMTALPQALTYLLSSPKRDKPSYALLVNGREFVFVELTYPAEHPCYRLSRSFSIQYPEQDLNEVLQRLRDLSCLLGEPDVYTQIQASTEQ